MVELVLAGASVHAHDQACRPRVWVQAVEYDRGQRDVVGARRVLDFKRPQHIRGVLFRRIELVEVGAAEREQHSLTTR